MINDQVVYIFHRKHPREAQTYQLILKKHYHTLFCPLFFLSHFFLFGSCEVDSSSSEHFLLSLSLLESVGLLLSHLFDVSSNSSTFIVLLESACLASTVSKNLEKTYH